MRFDFLGRVSRLAAIGAILLGSASCIRVNEELGEHFGKSCFLVQSELQKPI